MPMNLITPIYAYSTELTHTEFQTRYEELSSDGYRLIHIDAFSNGIVTYYEGHMDQGWSLNTNQVSTWNVIK
ncbi:MAG: hypothetical protein IPG99_15130 [Ignavibacteria bacterium]|nr:hypothetical protein [Ignavibacteria bacterium]